MKSLLLVISLVFLSFSSFGEYADRIAMPYWTIVDTVNPRLPANQASITFQVINPEFRNIDFTTIIKTSVNGVWKEVKLDANNQFQYQIEPGTYEFQFYVNNVYQEISVPEKQIQSQHDMLIGLNFMAILYRDVEIEVAKPVIYLSAEKETQFSLNIIPKGEFSFTYPSIQEGWSGKTNSDGSISINGANYPYLFWESNQTYVFRPVENGYKVKKEDVLSFLKKHCDELGFTANQKADFITYWGPKMSEYDELFVQFQLNEACNEFASLDITPQPAHINRVYIAISPWSDVFSKFVNEVALPKISSDGFTLLEWGGFTFDYQNDYVFQNNKP